MRERRSPGLAALFDMLAEDGRHAILDLGEPTAMHLRILGRFASQVRFAGVVASPAYTPLAGEAAAALAPNPSRPYDVVLAWDVLDRLPPTARGPMMRRLVEVTAPMARLHAIVRGEGPVDEPMAFTLVARDRVGERPLPSARAGGSIMLPAELERVLAPFEVLHAFMLRTGAREYVAVKRDAYRESRG